MVDKQAQSQSEKASETGDNIVFDIESENLTYNQARSIRMKIEKDVQKLANRVRMLQEEEERAIKKIADTRKKTQEIKQHMNKSDEEYRRKILEMEKSKIQEEVSKKSVLESKMKSQKDFKIRATEIQQQKLQAVNELRLTKQQHKQQMDQNRQLELSNVYQKKQRITQEKTVGQQKQNQFIKQKVSAARASLAGQTSEMQNQISQYEKEAQELEKLEADLLKKLQETQNHERIAFQRLENAMIEASVPKRIRTRAGGGDTDSEKTSQSRVQSVGGMRNSSRGAYIKSEAIKQESRKTR